MKTYLSIYVNISLNTDVKQCRCVIRRKCESSGRPALLPPCFWSVHTSILATPPVCVQICLSVVPVRSVSVGKLSNIEATMVATFNSRLSKY